MPIEATWICRSPALAEPSGLDKTQPLGVQRVSIGMGVYTQLWPDGDARIPVAPFISCVVLDLDLII